MGCCIDWDDWLWHCEGQTNEASVLAESWILGEHNWFSIKKQYSKNKVSWKVAGSRHGNYCVCFSSCPLCLLPLFSFSFFSPYSLLIPFYRFLSTILFPAFSFSIPSLSSHSPSPLLPQTLYPSLLPLLLLISFLTCLSSLPCFLWCSLPRSLSLNPPPSCYRYRYWPLHPSLLSPLLLAFFL